MLKRDRSRFSYKRFGACPTNAGVRPGDRCYLANNLRCDLLD